MRAFTRFIGVWLLAAGLPATSAFGFTLSGNWMRDYVRQREAAVLEQLGGVLTERLSVTPRIVGGGVAPAGKWPFQVGLLNSEIADNLFAQYCGGTLAGPRHVITAAHCVEFLGAPNQLHVLTGTQSLASGGTRRTVASITVHPDFDADRFDYDIAVIRLKKPVTGIAPVSLLSQPDEPELADPGTRAFVVGWGNTGPVPPSFPLKLHQVKVPIVARSVCNRPRSYDGFITARMLCAGLAAGGKDSCQGDSGGPLIVRDRDGKFGVQAGIVSFGAGCALPDFYGVYSRVAVLSAWANSVIAAEATP